MPRNEEGEFELVLANKQLLSVFFIVVLLLSVCFTMGYIIGRGSTPEVTADSTPPRKDTKPLVVDSAAPPGIETPASETPAAAPSKAAPSKDKEPISTAPQQPAVAETKKSPPKAAPAETAKAEPAKIEQTKTAPAKSEPSKSTAKSESAKASAAKTEPPAPVSAKGEPASGETYLQLVATAKAEADVMVDVLKKKGFRAVETPVPNSKDGWIRVLVGPIADGGVNKTRADLESSGFPGDKAIKKTF